MESKTIYLAVSGKNQLPFDSKEAMFAYFENNELYSSIKDKIKYFELIVKSLNSENHG